ALTCAGVDARTTAGQETGGTSPAVAQSSGFGLEFTPLARVLHVRTTVFSRSPSLLPSNLHSPSRRDCGIHPTERGNRGRYQKDRRQGGTQKAQAYGAQKGSAQGQAHHSARLAEEKSEEDGARPVEAVRTGARCQVSVYGAPASRTPRYAL